LFWQNYYLRRASKIYRKKMNSPIETGKTYIKNGTTFRVVVNKQEDGVVYFSPECGGFGMKAPTSHFEKRHSLAAGPRAYVFGYFGGDWMDLLIPGYNLEGALWNGWSMPYFTKEGADQVCDEVPSLSYDSEKDRYVMTNEESGEDPDYWEAEMINIEGLGDVKVYAIGAGFWCWDGWGEAVNLKGIQS
jgi:hypothetical protein